MVAKNHDYSKFGGQIYAGDNAHSKDPIPVMNKLWATDSEGLYWCGSWYHRTPLELLNECTSTIRDLLLNHPELINKNKET